MPPGYPASTTTTTRRTSSTSSTRAGRGSRSTARSVLGPGGLVHVESTTPRKVSNASEDGGSRHARRRRQGRLRRARRAHGRRGGRRAARGLRTRPTAPRHDLRGRSRGVRPLHGPVLEPAAASVPRLRGVESGWCWTSAVAGRAHSVLVERFERGRQPTVRAFVAAARERHPGVRVELAPARSCRSTTRSSKPRSPARRPLHGRPGRRLREMARVTPRRRGRRVRLGSRRQGRR